MAQVSGAGPVDARGFASSRLALLDRSAHRLEAEQERWFLWLPVMFGGGIALYFVLPAEPLDCWPPCCRRWRRWPCMPPARAAARSRLGDRCAAGGDARAGGGQAAHGGRARAGAASARSGPSTSMASSSWSSRVPAKGQRLTIRVTALREARAARAWPLSRARAHDGGERRAQARRRRAPQGNAQPAAGAGAAGRLRFCARGLVPGRWAPSATPPARRSSTANAAAAAARRCARPRRSRACARRSAGASSAALPGETGAIANALITGERGGISEATNQAFRDSGLFHILSISGLHMVIMAGAVFFSIRLAAGRHSRDRAALPDQEMGGGGRDGSARSAIC